MSAHIYGICYGEGFATITEECASLETARALACELLDAGDATAVDVVELEGAGPYYDSDGTQIAETHAPRRTVERLTLASDTTRTDTPNEVAAAAATLGRKGGSQRTPKQAEARRANGRKGGRPAINVPALLVIRSDGGDGGWSIHPDVEPGPDVDRDDFERYMPVLASGEATWRDDIDQWSRPVQADFDAAIRAWRQRVRAGYAEAPAFDNRHVITEDGQPYSVEFPPYSVIVWASSMREPLALIGGFSYREALRVVSEHKDAINDVVEIRRDDRPVTRWARSSDGDGRQWYRATVR